MERAPEGTSEFLEDFEFEVRDAGVLRLIHPAGIFEALASGRTEVVITSPRAAGRFSVEVAGSELRDIPAVHHTQVDQIGGEDVLFVGHANLDGFDHTAVAKAGIDRWVRAYKARGQPVVYWMSEEFPYWYTEDRRPDLGIISEGQEHQIPVNAERVVFAGGDFMFCLLRNAQMTLHGMLSRQDRHEVHFVFPPDAIWIGDIWGAAARGGYPAPMVLLRTLFTEQASDQEIYQAIVVPFLDRLFTDYPVDSYPSDAPGPHLEELVEGWNVEVVLDDGRVRAYRRASSRSKILMEFTGWTSDLDYPR